MFICVYIDWEALKTAVSGYQSIWKLISTTMVKQMYKQILSTYVIMSTKGNEQKY